MAVEELSPDEARELTDRIKGHIAEVLALLALMAEAFERRADVALGYQTWSAYCHAEFPALNWNAVEERRGAVLYLKGLRMSNRAIGHALSMDERTVRNDLSRAGNSASRGEARSAPRATRGLDGKVYPATRAPRQPKPDCAEGFTWRTTTAPIYYAQRVAEILGDFKRQDWRTPDLTPEQWHAIQAFRGAMEELVRVFEIAEAIKEAERWQEE
jgi:hypothetical protein